MKIFKSRQNLTVLFLFAVNTIFAQWEWSNPSPQGNNLNDIVKVPGVDKWIAVGDYGTIMHSTDGGNNWNVDSTNFINDLYKIVFPSSSIGFISASDGLILKSVDSGNTWTTSLDTNIITNDFISISFTNTQIGYALGQNSSLLKTIDGGNSWSNINKPSGAYYGMQFINKDTGYICGYNFGIPGYKGTIFRTYDGGNNWDTLLSEIDDRIEDIFFVNTSVGYAVGGTGGGGGFVRKTVDGGNNWDTINIPVSNDCHALFFFDPDTGYVVCKFGEILKTVDGGSNFTNLTYSEAGYLNGVYFSEMNIGFTVGQGGSILRTLLAGASWTTQTGLLVGTYGINDIVFVNDSTGFAGVYPNTLLQTTDRGNTWNDIGAIGTALEPLDMFFLNEDTGFMVGYAEQVKKTTDGGLNWSEKLNLAQVALSDIKFVNSTKGFIVGQKYLYRSTDAGETWLKDSLGSDSINLYSISFPSAMIGYIGGSKKITDYDYQSILYKTIDGGASWNTLTLIDSNYGLNSVWFINDSIGFSTSYLKIHKTTDGGISWTTYDLGNNFNAYQLFFVNDTVGYVSGYDAWNKRSLVYKTLDQGIAWFTQEVPTRNAISAIYFTNENEGYVSGYYGNILKTTNGGVVCPNPEIATFGDVDTLCLGDYIQFENSDENYSNDIWTIEDSVYMTDGFTHTFYNQGNIQILLEANNSGCVKYDTVAITILGPPDASFTFEYGVDGNVTFYHTDSNNAAFWNWSIVDPYIYIGCCTPSMTYQFLSNDSFQIALEVQTANYCIGNDTQWIFINNVGIKETEIYPVLNTQPNPFQDHILLTFYTTGLNENVSVVIRNMLGQIVQKQSILNVIKGDNKLFIDLSNLEQGNYILSLQSEEAIETIPIIKID